MITSDKPLKDIFFCPEESSFYSHCLEKLVLNNCVNSESIIELGSGDGSPVINSLLRSKFNGIVHGFEMNHSSCELAEAKIEEYGLSNKYIIYNKSFFDSSKPQADYLISNPPYLPALDNKIYQPLLHGGIDGTTITKELLALDYENALLMVSSYSNPEAVIDHAIIKGYHVADFVISPLNFGYYSSDPKVKSRIEELRSGNMAFYSENIYLLAGVLFTKQDKSKVNLHAELVQLMTAL